MAKKRRQYVEHHKQSLGDQMEDPETYGVRTKPRPEKRRKGESDDEEEHVPGVLSNRILEVAREQQEEVEAEDIDNEDVALGGSAREALAAAMQGLAGVASDSDDDDDDAGAGGFGRDDFSDPGSAGWEEECEEAINGEDEAALAAFMNHSAKGQKQKTLSDVIMEKIREKQGQAGLSALPREGEEASFFDDDTAIPSGLDPKVVEVYRGVGQVLSRYTAGRVPKAFKVIPNLKNWEEVLFLTEPKMWTPHAVYQATRMFVSNLNARMAQRFLALVLLPAVRRDIQDNSRLHFALFQSLKKATYKPGAFYKGFLLPLCASGTCTLREAVIITSVLRRASIPVMHSAAALLRIAEMPYSGVNSFFIRVLLDKKYALPYRVVDSLVDHFTSFGKEERQLPVVWHQALLCFIQRYKAEIRKEDKEALRALCRAQHHYLVTPEVMREIDASRSRGERVPEAAAVTAAAAAVGRVQSKVGGKVQENPRDLAPMILMDD